MDEEKEKFLTKDDKPTSKKVGIKTWYLCKRHMTFTIHNSLDCKLGKE